MRMIHTSLGALLFLTGCASAPDLPAFADRHPASANAPESPLPERSDVLHRSASEVPGSDAQTKGQKPSAPHTTHPHPSGGHGG